MLKHVYRIIILVAIFIASLFYFSKDIKEVVFNIDNTTKMEDATFPLVTLRSDNNVINLIYGYSSNMDAISMRNSLTPIGANQTYDVMIAQNQYNIKKLNFEIREYTENELIEKGSVSVFEEDDELKIAKISLSSELQQDKEYAVKITLISSESRKFYFYHRIKKHENTYLTEKLDFVMELHEAIKDKDKAEEYAKYLEPDSKKDNTTLANVNINSSFDLITWGDLKPEFITKAIPTIVENYPDIASVMLEYIVRANVSGIPELYKVKEYYRIRYSADRMYLLNYERRMEALFDIELASVSKSQLKLGITSYTDIPYLSSPDDNKFAFVRNNELWFYNIETNEIVKVFSFRQEETDYIRDINDQHDIRILNMDAEGNIDFMVYGYMNRGQYEGKVALILYKYIQADQRIEEKVYIPINEPYQKLKENLGEFAYVNSLDVFYFQIYNSIYAYDLITRQMTTLADNINKDDVLAFYQEGYVAWQESSIPLESDSIKLMDIETGEIQMIKAPKGYKVLLLDKIDTNLIYGFVEEDAITTLIDGRTIAPMNKIEIASTQREVLKAYSKEGYYIIEIDVKDNRIELYRATRQVIDGSKIFSSTSMDYIMNRSIEKVPYLNVVSRITESSLTEYYVDLSSGFDMKEVPDTLITTNTVISEDPTLRLPKDIDNMTADNNLEHRKYYSYILGELEGEYNEAAEAIAVADEGVGVVLSNSNNLVWERGVKANKRVISELETMNLTTSSNTIESCIKLLASYASKNIDNKTFDFRNTSVYDVLASNISKEPISLTGATLDQVLYNVSMGRPVIAMTGQDDAVLIYGFDAYNIFVIDPNQGKSVKMRIQDSTQLFETAGNIFISYLD